MNHRSTLARACTGALFAGASLASHAQDVSRIVAATIYNDAAVVERQLKTPGGTRHVQIDCMPPGFKASTLQIDGDPSVHLGDVRTELVTGDDALACARGPLDARIRALDDQKALLEAQSHADDLAVDYLRRWNGGAAEPAGARPANAGQAMPGADTLRKSALELMTDQLRLAHQLSDVDHQLAALQKETHQAMTKGNWSTLRFDVSTTGAATLRLSYQAADAHWRLGYRAALDTARSTVQLDRLAEIAQGSGEDWTDVALTLALRHVHNSSAPNAPETWNLNMFKASSVSGASVQRVEVTGSRIDRFSILPDAMPATATVDRTPVVSMGAEERDGGTLFHASRPFSLPSDGQAHTLALDSRTLPVHLRLQAVPLHELAAFVLAEAPAPAGTWPYGPLQKWRDGALIDTEEDWSLENDDDVDHLAIYFGRDDRVRITVQRPAAMTAATGFFGGQTQKSWGSVFVVTNNHTTPQMVELLDMAPVSHDESVKVVSKYDPAPTVTDWQHKPGVEAWTLVLGPNQTRQVSVSHEVTFPKDTTVRTLPTP